MESNQEVKKLNDDLLNKFKLADDRKKLYKKIIIDMCS
jgi:hypothetical protein